MKNRFESLELQGFKTFATLTRLEFPGQITAIVGPNGSGKSNIADGVRWVLGEQAFTILRAKRTEDMIFSGSQQRSRAGMASTTITFNNEDGWLPIDYSTVSISRRASRDGQNDYILNGQKVRLKDISELLSQTGLAERTYTIIGQGLVDIALALRPDERRKLFEEAAGIGLYRSRKEEALRRLSNTERNLERVLDILTEIKPRLRSLEKQADRFAEYEDIRSALHNDLQIWYGYQWHHSNNRLKDSETLYRHHEDLLERLKIKTEAYGLEENQLKSALLEKRNSLEHAQTELIQYQQRYDENKKELAILEERQNSFEIQKKNLVEDIYRFNKELSDITKNKQHFQEEIDQRKEELDHAVEKTNQIEIQLAQVSSKRESTQAKLDISRQSRINHETRKVQLSVRIEELENSIASLSMEQEKIKNGIARLEEEKRQISGEERSIKANFDEAEQLLLKMKEERSHFSGDLEKAYDESKTIELNITSLETKSAKAQAQLEVLKQAEEALSGYSEGSRVIVNNSRKGRLPGGIDPLSKHFIVEELYEKAISAALGELTDILIMPSRGKDVLIQYLESKESDRVALIAHDDIHTGDRISQFKNMDGYLGIASEMVKVESKYQPLIDHLLKETVIVRDRVSAQKILPSLSGAQKVVTLQGIVFQANGVLISGTSRSGKRISRTRRRQEIQEAFDTGEAQIRKLRQKKEKFVKKIMELENQFQSLKQQTQSLEEKLKTYQIQHQQKKDHLNRLDEQLVWHTSQREEIDRKLVDAQTKKGIAEKDLASCVKDIEALLTEEKSEIEILKEHSVFDLQQSLNYWKTHRIVAQNSLDAAQQRFKDHASRASDAQQRLGHYQTRLTHIENSINEIRKTESLCIKESDNLESKIKEITAEYITPLSGEVNELEEKHSQVSTQMIDVQNEIIPAERKLNMVQLELMQKKERLTSLEERIEADFNLVTSIREREDPEQAFSVREKIIHQLPDTDVKPEKLDDDIKRQKRRLRGIGAINPESRQEYIEVKERFDFLEGQVSDLQEASQNLQEVIEALDNLMERDFLKTFKAVGEGFKAFFKRLFNGGDAKLKISDEENPVEGGIDLVVRLPGRRQQGLALLSGGERSLTAVALIFALLKVSPTPFCILDEVDAMLDESNVGRFVELLRELSNNTQFIIITHNRNTVQAADVIYGVTMGRDATSQMISLKLEEVDETFVE